MFKKILQFLSPGLYERTTDRFGHLRGSGIKTLGANIASLSILQAANYILPLVTLPYLVRVLGADKFGLVALAQAVIQYFVILTDYGFSLSATKQTASHRGDLSRISELFSTVLVIKSLFMIVGLALLWLLTSVIGRLGEIQALLFLTYGIVVGNVLFPVWFYQGMEQMHYTTVINLTGRSLYVVLIFLCIHRPDDYLVVPVLNAVGFIVTGLICLMVAWRRFHIRFRLPSRRAIVRELQYSFQFFISRLSVSLYTSFNTVVLGFVTTDQIVGYYAAADKLFIAMRSAFYPLVLALYPYMSKRKQVRIFHKIFYPTVALAVIAACCLYLLSDQVTMLVFGPDFAPAAAILRLFALLVPVVAASIMLGYPFLAALGGEKYANYSLAFGSVSHLLLVIFLVPVMTVQIIVLITLITEIIILAIRIYGVSRHKLWRHS